MTPPTLIQSARRIFPLAWPVLIGQLAVLAFGTVDTVLVARSSATDLAALAIGAATYISVFIGLMGVVLAVSPITGRLFGAKQLTQAGHQLHQAFWLALGFSVLGCCVLLFPQPFLSWSQASPEVAQKVRVYLRCLAFALPPALLFTAFRGFNTAVSRPKMVMAIQLGALLLKLPLTTLLVFGATLGPWRIEPMGATGCGIATAVVMWLQCLCAWQILRRDPFYAPFGLHRPHIHPPHGPSLRQLVRLGVPMGLSILIEVTGFTFMAFFVARMGTTAVAGHQLVANLMAMLFMMPLALGNATATLVAQRLGASDTSDAKRLSWHGVQIGLLVATVVGCSVYFSREKVLGFYTPDPIIIQAALPLLSWLVLFHVADAAQAVSSFVLRSYHVVTVPLVIYCVAIWGVGLGGGYVLAFNSTGSVPLALQGARGFWSAAAMGLLVAGLGLCIFLAQVARRER
jgi:multidrug resistance protein, MATE family